MSKPIIIGIDLGTTFSAAAYVTEEGALEELTSGKSIPSVVFIKNGDIVVGATAMNRRFVDESHTVRCVKRAIGRFELAIPQQAAFRF